MQPETRAARGLQSLLQVQRGDLVVAEVLPPERDRLTPDRCARTSWYRQDHLYASRVLPGTVQTREYTAAVLRSIQRDRGVDVDDVDAAVQARMCEAAPKANEFRLEIRIR